ncbi:MAG: ornithine carbamoyltransferase [Deltaproteobacteria bacterium]|nr:ornithine carbamoyltransferase [Deltaproteobacteria bacterium]
MTPQERDLLTLWDLTAEELMALFPRAAELKVARQRGQETRTLPGKMLGMIFEKPSTRTRVSFEVATVELGGHAVYLAPEGSQIGRGEPISDTARVLGGYCHGIVIRTFAQARAEELARWAPVPVINGLTDHSHPCQVIADLFTTYELLGDLQSPRYAWIGDGNNMAHSWIEAAAILGLDLVLACPEGYEPSPAVLARAREHVRRTGKGRIELTHNPRDAARSARVISTDVWASMGQEKEAQARRKAFTGFCVDESLLLLAAHDSIVLHCLPAHRGEEISEGVLEGPHSAAWRQAENRLHSQKAILELFLGKAR